MLKKILHAKEDNRLIIAGNNKQFGGYSKSYAIENDCKVTNVNYIQYEII